MSMFEDLHSILPGDGELQVEFLCPYCASENNHIIDDAYYDQEAEEISDGIGRALSVVNCPQCDRRLSIEVTARPNQKQVVLKDDIGTSVIWHDGSLDQQNEWSTFLANYQPQEPYEVFKKAVDEMENLHYGSEIHAGAEAVYLKMAFLQYISILEAYLSDRLIKLVMDNPDKMLALIGATPALRERGFKLIELAKEPDLLKNRVKAYLQRFSFHDLPEVAKFYRAVLKIDIFPQEYLKDRATFIIEQRHHLVHRNGRDTQGNVIPVRPYQVNQVKHLVKLIVTAVEHGYEQYKQEKREAKRRSLEEARLAALGNAKPFSSDDPW